MSEANRRYTPRLYLSADLSLGQQIETNTDTTHYIGQVMRRKSGDDIILFNGHDGEWRADILSLTKKGVQLICREQTRPQKFCQPLALCFALIKRDHQDYLIQKASEVGVTHFFPLITQNCSIRSANLNRMQAIAREAAEQCDRLDVPTIAAPQNLTACLEHIATSHALFACLEAGQTQPIASGLKSAPPEVTPTFLVGPEGGFTPSERELILRHPSVVTISLGPRLLRADTAAIVALSCWQAMHGDWATQREDQS